MLSGLGGIWGLLEGSCSVVDGIVERGLPLDGMSELGVSSSVVEEGPPRSSVG